MHKPVQVVWIENGPGLCGDGVSGGSMRLYEVASHWRKTGLCDQFVVTTPGGDTIHRNMALSLPALVLRASILARTEHFRAARFWSYVVTAADFRARWRRTPRPDVIITASDYFCDVLPALRLKRSYPGSKWIAWVHHRELPPGRRPGPYWINWGTYRMQGWSLRRIASQADDIWVYDSPSGLAVRDTALSAGAPEERIYGMRNGVDLAAVADAGAPAKEFDAVMVGLRPNKGLLDIVPVWQQVQRLRPGTTLRLLGCRRDLDPVWPEIVRSGLERVIHLAEPEGPRGFFFKTDLYRLMKTARLLFAPSREEGWGIAVCEAMACGLPVVAYDLPVYRKIYGDALRIVPAGNHGAMAAQLCEILNDATLQGAYRERGLACALQYDWSRLAQADWMRVKTVAGSAV